MRQPPWDRSDIDGAVIAACSEELGLSLGLLTESQQQQRREGG